MGGRCTWIDLPELLDRADKQNLLCQLCQYYCLISEGQKERGKKKKEEMEPKSSQQILNS